MDLSNAVIGFIGCGKISSAVARGYATSGPLRPRSIIISPRNEDKAAILHAAHPDIIEIASSNEDVVLRSNIVFIGLLPAAAAEILPKLVFTEEQMVISMMAAVNYADVLSMTGTAMVRTARIVPLPSAAKRSGPILCFPPNAQLAEIVSVVGTPVICSAESEMKPLVSITGHISAFYELMSVAETWAVSNGVGDEAARRFISSFYCSLALSADTSNEAFSAMSHEAATPGGLNEQSLVFLKRSDHFALFTQSLECILERLKK